MHASIPDNRLGVLWQRSKPGGWNSRN